MPHRSLFKVVGYDLIRMLARMAGVILFRMRCLGRRNLPVTGPVLVCSNHQSTLDPVLVGLAFDRRLNYLARRSLFKLALFRWIIEFLDAIPIDRDGMGFEGLKESLRRLRRGEAVLIFPEGTRSFDGNVAPLRPGFCMLARRGRATLLPVAIDGAFDVLPRTNRIPRLFPVQVCIGEPISPDFIEQADDKQLVVELERRIRDCHRRAREGRLR